MAFGWHGVSTALRPMKITSSAFRIMSTSMVRFSVDSAQDWAVPLYWYNRRGRYDLGRIVRKFLDDLVDLDSFLFSYHD